MPSPLLHDTSFVMEHATREAREATFVPPTKRTKAAWPHKTPTATDLAKAGFYYRPSPHSNDNTVCFLCDRNLDGWEAEDDPIQEHLKHAEDCGWAIMMNVVSEDRHDTANMEDPTGQKMVDARRATFAVGWPHEGKRGWTCKTEKMVEAGWYFAPTSGSEDYVSCAYCKLSLDGWEPKDNPFEEHYSRSPSCEFFFFAGTTAPSKRSKAKKGRTSRASRTSKASMRLSTQSNTTLQSEAPSIPDLDESIDTSVVSVLSTASTATNKGKRKAGTNRAKTTKSKRSKTVKPKKVDGTQTEEEAPEETSAESVSYLQLRQQSEQEPQKTDIPVDAAYQDFGAQETPRIPSPGQANGPPRLPTPTIPVSAESPVPTQSQKQQTKTSPTRSAVRLRVQTPPPATQSSPSQPSDVENAPPSMRPETVRPPLPSPSTVLPKWDAVDVDIVFENTSSTDVVYRNRDNSITDAEKQMTVQEWIRRVAAKAEDELRAEGERVVGIFEKEGQRALTVLEGIVCV